jgi:uncharacterized YccA/Bax inhibitor family protein
MKWLEKTTSVGSLVGWWSFVVRDFGPCGIIFMNMCVVMAVAMVMLLRDFGPCGIIFVIVCVY